jgi:hypothetical protein
MGQNAVPPAILSTLRHDDGCPVRSMAYRGVERKRGEHPCTCPTLSIAEREARYAEWRKLHGLPPLGSMYVGATTQIGTVPERKDVPIGVAPSIEVDHRVPNLPAQRPGVLVWQEHAMPKEVVRVLQTTAVELMTALGLTPEEQEALTIEVHERGVRSPRLLAAKKRVEKLKQIVNLARDNMLRDATGIQTTEAWDALCVAFADLDKHDA